MANADRLVGDEAFAVGREVTDAAQRARRDGVGVEHDDVGGLSDFERPAVGEAEDARGLAA